MTGIPDILRTSLGNRYEVQRTVGRGGMATVYLARDVKHGREVALKVLRPELAASLGTDRFLNEISIAARLAHPHIVPLYDSGEAGGLLYYVMPFVSGESLRDVLNREGRLELARAVDIAVQVADALRAAHEMGVLHRDIKPENILLSGAHAFVVDFGVAKAISTAGGANLTRTGYALGTPGYMSPEQAAGVRELDARTDVYGLACVVYEMLVGETPGLWPSDEAVRVGRFIEATAAQREQLDELPGRVEQALTKALAMRPAERFATASAFADALLMASATSGERYDRVQARDVLVRAADLDAEYPTEEGMLSVGTLEQVAAEVGIPPERVREAIAQLLHPTHERGPVAEPNAPDPTDEKYGDTQVRQILGRAVELESEPGLHEAFLRIADIEQAAAEVGIPPERVHEAIHGIGRPTGMSRLYGRPTTTTVERTVVGELREAAYPAMLAEINAALGIPGRATTRGGSLMWSATPLEGTSGRNVFITITPRGGETKIRLAENTEDLSHNVGGSALGWFGGGVFGTALALAGGATGNSLLFLLGIGCAAGGAYAVSRSLYLSAALQREDQLNALADKLSGYALRPELTR